MLESTRHTLLRQLRAHRPLDPAEGLALAGAVDLLETHPQPFARSSFDPGHITASAWLLDHSGERLAFVWHEKFARLIQAGGHCEESDASVEAAALRELQEETGCARAQVRALLNVPLDVNLHAIPHHGREGRHQHFDLSYAYQLRGPAELPLVTWLPVAEVSRHQEAGMRRCARKLTRLLMAERV